MPFPSWLKAVCILCSHANRSISSMYKVIAFASLKSFKYVDLWKHHQLLTVTVNRPSLKLKYQNGPSNQLVVCLFELERAQLAVVMTSVRGCFNEFHWWRFRWRHSQHWTHVVDDVVDFIRRSSGTGKGLDVGRGLSDNVCPVEDDEEHLQLDTCGYCFCSNALILIPNGRSDDGLHSQSVNFQWCTLCSGPE